QRDPCPSLTSGNRCFACRAKPTTLLDGSCRVSACHIAGAPAATPLPARQRPPRCHGTPLHAPERPYALQGVCCALCRLDRENHPARPDIPGPPPAQCPIVRSVARRIGRLEAQLFGARLIGAAAMRRGP